MNTNIIAMRNFKHLLAMLMAMLCIFPSQSQELAAPKIFLNYSRLTNGLNVPTFEGGRTDFAMNDINDDGHVDILSIGDHGSPYINSTQHGIMVWFNDGQGNFSLHMEGNFGYGGIAVGDANNDGFKDVGYGMHHNYSSSSLGNQLIEVALGDGSGMNWTAWDTGLATNGETWGMFGTDFGDVNNNGLLDLVSISFGCCAGFHVYLNQGDGSWVPSFGLLGNNSDMIIKFADLNNDGLLDFVAGHALGTAWFGDGSGNFIKNDAGLPPYGSNSPRNGISVGDVNNDGSFGLAYINSGGGVEVYEFNQTLNQWVSFSGNLPASGSYQRSQLYDMNADGFLDVMAFGNRTFQLWLGDGQGNWTPDATFQTPATPGTGQAFTAGGDLNGNGFGDVVILANEGSWWSYQNKFYVYAENSIPDSLWIRPLYPKGNEKFFPGSVRFIQWASAVPGAETSSVKIEISAFGPDGPWWMVAEGLPNNGKYQWTVPYFGSDNTFLRLTVLAGDEESSSITGSPFTVLGEPTAIRNPNENQNELMLFPNPGTDKIYFNSLQRILSLEIYSSHGQKVASYQNPEKFVDVGMLAPGLYICRIINIDGSIRNVKWTKSSR